MYAKSINVALKFLASTVPEIWRGPKISKVGHVTRSGPHWPNFAFCSLVRLVICMRAKLEVYCFNRFWDMEGSQNFKSRSRDPFSTQFDLILHFSRMTAAVNLSVIFDTNIFIGDWYMAVLLLRRFGCEMPIPAHFGEVFFGDFKIWPPECSLILSRPPKGTSLAGNTRFGI